MQPRWANNYSSTLSAAVADTTGTSVSVTSATGLPSLTAPTGAVQPIAAILIGNEIMHVTAVSTTTLTVRRGQDGTAAATHANGATVTAVVTRDTLYGNASPGAVSVAIPTGTQTYTPDAAFKYHFLTVGGSTTLTIAAPAGGTLPAQAGDELRIHFTITSTALSAQPTWNAVYDNSPVFSVTLTAGARSSVSFAHRGGTTNPLWRRIQ